MKVRPNGQGPGDADALALSAAELVGEPVCHVGIQPYDPQEGGDPLHSLGSALRKPVHNEGLADDVAGAHARVQGAVGVLEDDLHAAAHRPKRPALQAGEVNAVEGDVPRRRTVELEDAAAHGGLARAALSHQT